MRKNAKLFILNSNQGFQSSRGLNQFPGLRSVFQTADDFMDETVQPITLLLKEAKQGNAEALNKLLPQVYDELRRLAKSHLSRERSDHTLQPTALVHETFLRLINQKQIDWQDRAHFFGIAAHNMREVLVDYARTRNAQKRGGGFKMQISPDDAFCFASENTLDVIAINEALMKLEKIDARQAKIVELKFFGSLEVKEIAEVLNISPATVKREWSSARLLLYRFLNSK